MKQFVDNNILILVCYFGRLPWYFEYFAHSSRYNPSVDFIIITDDRSYTKQLPKNVKFIYTTLHDISNIATQKLGFNVHIGHPYKLCDFKPAYAFLFPDLIKGYKYWCHGDLDVIYGNIRNFMTSDLLNEFDIISVRHDYLTGHFTLFRNCKKLNTLFMKSKDYVKVFTGERNFCFDETNYAFDAFTDGIPFAEIVTEIESMTHVVKRLAEKKYLKAYFDFHIIEGIPGKLKWENGKLFYKGKFEVMMYHLIKFKTIYKPKKNPSTLPNRFHISPSRIYFK